jgi:hypothetical protein
MEGIMEFPKKAKYKRNENRIYFYGDFEDGEEIEFAYRCDKPNASAIGNVWYKSCGDKWKMNLVNIRDLNY